MLVLLLDECINALGVLLDERITGHWNALFTCPFFVPIINLEFFDSLFRHVAFIYSVWIESISRSQSRMR